PLRLEKIFENLHFLENDTKAHMHLDLIVGLPGETIEGFGRNLDKLVSLTHSEIQIGILKNLSGTTLSRHDKEHKMIYSDIPPYDILQNNNLSFVQIQKMKRFARFWDLYYNSGNFDKSVRLLWKEEKAFDGFYAFSEWIFTQTLSTWKISLDRQISLMYEYLLPHTQLEVIQASLIEDINTTPGRRIPFFLTHDVSKEGPKNTEKQVTPKRQAKRVE
ncbi:MAG: DUF4080 domain-containing protein, partial [Sulfuricurvum sp.]|nr:DUF4080 domain-containing protein [Sulfuricurvum sp.]